MLSNYFKTAWRILIRYKIFSLINISGLTIGITCCILVGLFITDELSYDTQNKDAGRIYRIVTDFVNTDGSKVPEATTPPALAEAIQKEVPEVDHIVRLFPPASAWGNKSYVRYGSKRFVEENVYHADASIFDVFTIPFVKGNPQNALENPDAAILTESTAKKYFGNEDPVGKTLYIDDWAPQLITAVIKDIPDNAHFKFDFLLSLKSLNDDNRFSNTWNWNSFYTYLKLKPGSDISLVEEKIRTIFKKNNPGNKNFLYTQPLTSIHLNSNLKGELEPNGEKFYIYISGLIASFVLLIACINYINLTTAHSALRIKEISIRKISGAMQPALIRQFLVESVLFTLISSIAALFIAGMVLPAINTITGKNLVLISHGNYFIVFLVALFAVVTGLLAGFYPALYISSFSPVRILKAGKFYGFQNFILRKLLIVLQFTISIILIIGTIIVIQQVNFIQSKKPGIDKEHVIIINDISYLTQNESKSLKNKLLQVNGVIKVAATDGVPGGLNWTRSIGYSGSARKQLINFLTIDEDFIPALSLQVKEGRNFSLSHPSDPDNAVILNETAVKELNIPSPVIGQKITWNENQQTGQISYVTIVGILKDFHFSSMKNEIKPFVFVTRNNRQWQFALKITGANTSQTLRDIKSVWDDNIKSRPFQYTFLDEIYARLYTSEVNFKKVFTYITFIALFISCLGLFGLAMFSAQRRTKEIAIRKVLGASTVNIANMLVKNFVTLITIAILIASPVALYCMNQWLQHFAYRISIHWWVFLIAGLSAILIAVLTISFQAIKTAMANPVNSLRTE